LPGAALAGSRTAASFATGAGPPARDLFPFPFGWCMLREMDQPGLNLDRGGELDSLIESTARGDRAAFASLYQRTSAKLFGIAVRLLGSEAEAEEVVQDVYLNLWRKADRFERLARRDEAFCYLTHIGGGFDASQTWVKLAQGGDGYWWLDVFNGGDSDVTARARCMKLDQR
jgi:hypothetical protein